MDSLCREQRTSKDRGEPKPAPPLVCSILLEHLIVTGTATAGESRVVGAGIRRDARNAGEGMQPVLTRGSFGMAALRNGVFVGLSRSRCITEPRHITAASLGIERLGQCRRRDTRGHNRGDQGKFLNDRHCLSPGYEANKDPMPCLPLPRRSSGAAGIPSRLRDSPGGPYKNNLFKFILGLGNKRSRCPVS